MFIRSDSNDSARGSNAPLFMGYLIFDEKEWNLLQQPSNEREEEKLLIIEFTVLENVLEVESEKFGCWWSLWMFYEFCIRFVHLNRWQTNGKLRNASELCCLNKPIESEKLGAPKSRCTTTQNNSNNFPPKQHDEGKVALWITCSACQERAKPEEDFLVTTDGTCFDIIWLHDYQAPTSNGRKGKVIVESCLSLEGSPHWLFSCCKAKQHLFISPPGSPLRCRCEARHQRVSQSFTLPRDFHHSVLIQRILQAREWRSDHSSREKLDPIECRTHWLNVKVTTAIKLCVM